MHQHGLFDVQQRHEKNKQYATILNQLNAIINWEEFRPTLETIRKKERKSNAGRKLLTLSVVQGVPFVFLNRFPSGYFKAKRFVISRDLSLR